MKIILIYPHQLFEDSKILENLHGEKEICVFLIEDYLYFSQYKFHKQKILLHRATMKFYENYLKEKYKNINIKYVNFDEADNLENIILKKVKKITEIYIYDVVDNYLEKKIVKIAEKLDTKLIVEESPMFLNTSGENKNFFTKADGATKKPFMKTFYEWQRKRLNILMEEVQGKTIPVGGQFSFDAENRKKLPKNYVEPKNTDFKEKYKNEKYFLEAKKYVEENFLNNYGDTDEFNYALNFTDAKKVLENFLQNKLKDFGIYEDAISSKNNFINHSVLSVYLNIGLLTPEYVVKQTLKFAKKHSKEIPINSLEGFLRQIIGWREFMRAMYVLHGREMRSKNFFKHKKELGEEFWTGDTNILPVDNAIKKVLKFAYNHHIERLMVLGNFMLLSEHSPDSIYEWFMTMYIDSYDWVMVPNVYGMSQFADGGIFATKPYISASNYILKMSDYKKDDSWDKVWDKLFWDFLKKHKTFFSKNIRFKMLLSRIK